MDGEHWWGLAVEQHTGGAGVVSNLVPWGALCKHSLAKFFRLVLGEESLNRPLVVSREMMSHYSPVGIGHGYCRPFFSFQVQRSVGARGDHCIDAAIV